MEECPFCGEKFISQLAEMPLPMRLSASFELCGFRVSALP